MSVREAGVSVDFLAAAEAWLRRRYGGRGLGRPGALNGFVAALGEAEQAYCKLPAMRRRRADCVG